MRLSIPTLSLIFCASLTMAADLQPWQKVTNPTEAQVAANFGAPPTEYSSQATWGWNGNATVASLTASMDRFRSLNINAAIITPGRLTARYGTAEYFELVRQVVQEAKKRNFRLWITDDDGYPSGFAGGNFTEVRPELRMEGLVLDRGVAVNPGATLTTEVGGDLIAAVATNSADGSTQLLTPADGKVSFTAPTAGNWAVSLVRCQFRSLPTRSGNSGSGAKDNTHSLGDFLNPETGKMFVKWTMDDYKNAIGDEFGKTVLGFRGDEPGYDVGWAPWSPVLFGEFQKRLGYDLRPYLPAVLATMPEVRMAGQSGAAPSNLPVTLDTAHRAAADYYDMWSDFFRDSFFQQIADWNRAHGMEYQLHVEHEHSLPAMARADGDYFKIFSVVQVPGIDTIWHQIWPDTINDFDKLASSAAHLYGFPTSMCEAFAAYNPAPDIYQARWIINQLLAHGITRIEYMGGGRGYMGDPLFPEVSSYVNRIGYVMSQGRPGAQIGLYIPFSSLWLGDRAAIDGMWALARGLFENQRDFDFVDEHALASMLKPEGNKLVNLSGQGYGAILIPPVSALSKADLTRLKAFAAAGGKVIFFGHGPSLEKDKNFLTATANPDISWATRLEPEVKLTPAVLAALPKADLQLAQPLPLVEYTHRKLQNADVYFIFNRSDQAVATQATFAGTGQAQFWDAKTGAIAPPTGPAAANGTVTVPLEIEGWGTKLIVVGPGAAPSAGAPAKVATIAP